MNYISCQSYHTRYHWQSNKHTKPQTLDYASYISGYLDGGGIYHPIPPIEITSVKVGVNALNINQDASGVASWEQFIITGSGGINGNIYVGFEASTDKFTYIYHDEQISKITEYTVGTAVHPQLKLYDLYIIVGEENLPDWFDVSKITNTNNIDLTDDDEIYPFTKSVLQGFNILTFTPSVSGKWNSQITNTFTQFGIKGTAVGVLTSNTGIYTGCSYLQGGFDENNIYQLGTAIPVRQSNYEDVYTSVFYNGLNNPYMYGGAQTAETNQITLVEKTPNIYGNHIIKVVGLQYEQ